MEETKKRQQEEEEEENDDSNEVATKKPRVSEVTDDGDDMGEDIMAWLSVDDETVGELMKLLETTTTTTETTTSNTAATTTTTTTRVKFINNPYSSSLIFQSSSSNYITINGNEETCGSSFSDTESSLMVSVDMSGIVNFVGLENGGAWSSNEVEARGWMVMEEEDGGGGGIGMDGCDGFDWDWDDDTLARFLGEDFC